MWKELLAVWAGAGVAELGCACTAPVAEVLRAPQPPLWVWITGSGAGCPCPLDWVVIKGGQKRISPGGRILPGDLHRAWRAPRPHSRAAFLLVSGAAWGRSGKPCLGQIQPLVPAAPSLHSPACPRPCLSLCTRRNTPRDRLLLCKPSSADPSSLRAAAGCQGMAAGV